MRNVFMLSLVGLTGCGLYWGGGDDDVSVGQLQEVLVMPTMPTHDLDLLFVIDDSPSMLDKQVNLRAAFPHFMDQLTSLPNGLPNVHIGVVTSDMGAMSTEGVIGPTIGGSVGGCSGAGKDGQLQLFEAASDVTGKFISDVDDGVGGRMRNYVGALRDVFSAISNAGAAGCGFEQHLSAMHGALSANNTANAGFLRPDANLGVVILADEDDCSFSDPQLLTGDTTVLGPLQSMRCTHYGVTCDSDGTTPDAMNQVGAKSGCHANKTSPYVADVAPYADFLKGLKADPAQVAVAAIVGTTTPFEIELRAPSGSTQAIPALAHSCTYTDSSAQLEVADPAVRLAEFTSSFGARGAVETICQSDLALPLTDVGLTMRGMMNPDGCLTRPLVDTAPEVAGVQPLCEVQDLDTQLPSCAAASPGSDCWRALQDPNTCPDSPANLRIEIDRAAVQTTQRYAHVRCLVAH